MSACPQSIRLADVQTCARNETIAWNGTAAANSAAVPDEKGGRNDHEDQKQDESD